MITMKTTWLVTWDWIGKHAEMKPEIVAILNYRYSAERVKKYIEQYYIDQYYSLEEKMACAKSSKNNPYPAEFGRINGVIFEGRITCGHNPWLFGRLVQNIRLQVNQDGKEQLLWDEIDRSNLIGTLV